MGSRMFTRSMSRRNLLKGTSAAATAAAVGFPAFAPIVWAQELADEQVLRLPGPTAINATGPFDLGTIGGGTAIQIANFLFEGLTAYDWDQKRVVPAAAESWDTSNDNLTFTFHLRPDLVWSDGSPLTAPDFEFAIKRNLDPALGANLAAYLYPLKGAEAYNTGETSDANSIAVMATDDLTLVMEMVGVTPYWPVMLSLWTSFPINQQSIEAGGDDWMQPEHLITNGRYVMESWTPDQSMVLVLNERFRGEQPTITRIEYTLFQDPNEQALTAFETGELDIANVSTANVDFVANDPELSELRRQIPVTGTWQLRLDLGNEESVLADVNVRKALYLAIDRDLLTQNVLKGVNTPALILTPPDISSWDPEGALDGTVEDAKAYLADAGYPDGNDFPGFRIGYVPTQENAQLVAEALIQLWNDNLGITTASAFAVPTDWRQRIRTEPYDMYLGQWIGDFPDPYMWHNVIFEGDSWQSHWDDSTYLDMIERAAVEPDLGRRDELYAEAEAYRIQDQMATIPLYVSGRLWVVQPWVQGLNVSPMDGPLLAIDEMSIAEH